MPCPTHVTDRDPQAHQECLGYLRPYGLLVAPAAMGEAGWLLQQGGRELLQRRYKLPGVFQPRGPDVGEQDLEDQPHGFRRLEDLLAKPLSSDLETQQLDTMTLRPWTSAQTEPDDILARSAGLVLVAVGGSTG